MKSIVFILTLLASSVSFGLEGLSGNWCQYNSSSREVEMRIEISSDHTYKIFEQNEGGQVLQLNSEGYFSFGVSHHYMYEFSEENPDIDLGVTEVDISNSAKRGRTLNIEFSNGSRDVYGECP